MTPDDSRAGSLDGLRVMVIDDSKTIRRTAETLLKREGAGRYAHFTERVYRLGEDIWGIFSLQKLARTPEFRQAAT